MRRIVGAILTITTALACPCHLPLTLPLLARVLGGTSLSTALLGNTGLLVALLAGLRLAAGLPDRTIRTSAYHVREPERGARGDAGRCGRVGRIGSPCR